MDKVQQSIDFLRKLETDDPYSLGFSGGKFRYWLRINGFRSEQFGIGTKWNSIKLKSRKK